MTHATDDEQRPPLGTSRARVLAGLRAAAGDLRGVPRRGGAVHADQHGPRR